MSLLNMAVYTYAQCAAEDCLGIVIPSLHPDNMKARLKGSDSWKFKCAKCGHWFTVRQSELKKELISDAKIRQEYPGRFFQQGKEEK